MTFQNIENSNCDYSCFGYWGRRRGYYFFGSPVNTQPTNVREQTKQTALLLNA